MLGSEYFEYYLVEEEQEFFRNNLLNQKTESYLWEYLDRDFDSFKDFLTQAFWFKETPESNEYWELLCSIRNDMHEKKVKIIQDFIRLQISDEHQLRKLLLRAEMHVRQYGTNEFYYFRDEE